MAGLEWQKMAHIVTAQDLRINLDGANEDGVFRWFIASFLMGKRIQTDIAVEAYSVIVNKHKKDTPHKLAMCTHRELVRMLGEARYVRYDESTATRLLALARKIDDEYAGKVSHLFSASEDRTEVMRRLRDFDGIGPKTAEIFMREMDALFDWKG
jgi:3-methyladenine DNA glycosylase/8-oxoguanine DNA glycosylase